MEQSQPETGKDAVSDFLDTHAKPWDAEAWIARKDRLKDCVWVDGTLLQHTRSDRVFFAPEPTDISVIYQLDKVSVVEAELTGRVVKKLGAEFAIVRLFIKRDAVLVKYDWCLAADLPKYLETLRKRAEKSQAAVSGHSLVDRAAQDAAPRKGLSKVVDLDQLMIESLPVGALSSDRGTWNGGGGGGGGGDNDGGGGGRWGGMGVRG
jgi:uncharacterized membrane protein YgcG